MVEPDEGLLEFEVVQLHARIFVESHVVLRQTEGVLKRLPRQLRRALHEQVVAELRSHQEFR